MLRVSDVVLNVETREVQRGQQLIKKPLTPLEFRVLQMLMSEPGRVFEQEQLLRECWGVNDPVLMDKTMRASLRRTITQIKQKLEEGSEAQRPQQYALNPIIRTSRGVGYSAGTSSDRRAVVEPTYAAPEESGLSHARPSSDPGTLELERRARELLDRRRRRAAARREQLRGWQKQELGLSLWFRTWLACPDLGRSGNSRQKRHRLENWFCELAVDAGRILESIDRPVLEAVVRRGIEVYPLLLRWTELPDWPGQVKLPASMRQLLDNVADGYRPFADDGDADVLRVIVLSAKALITADVDVLFPNPREGRLLHERGNVLVVLRRGRVELRSPSSPERVVAELPMSLDNGERVMLRGRAMLIGYDGEALCAWDPLVAGSPVEEGWPHTRTALDEYDLWPRDDGFRAAVHLEGPDGLHSLVLSQPEWLPAAWSISRLFDLMRVHRSGVPTVPPGRSVLVRSSLPSSPTVLSDTGCFGVHADRIVEIPFADFVGALFRVGPDDALGQTLAALPELQGSPVADWRISKLQSAVLNGQEYLATYVHTREPNAVSLLALLAPDETGFRLIGYYRPDATNYGDISNFDVCPSDSGPCILTAHVPNERSRPASLILCRGSMNVHGVWRFDEDSVISTSINDLRHVAPIDEYRGIVSDAAGGLYKYSRATGSFTEVDRDRASPISRVFLSEF